MTRHCIRFSFTSLVLALMHFSPSCRMMRLVVGFQQGTLTRQGLSSIQRNIRSYHSAIAAERRRKQDDTPTELSWEKFEFSQSPKWDSRFDQPSTSDESAFTVASKDPKASKQEVLESLYKAETKLDQEYHKEVKRFQKGWQSLDEETVQTATSVLLPHVNEKRVARIHAVLSKRTRHVTFLFENPANPSNVWACLRTIEAFGIQHVHVIVQSGQYKGKAALSQKRGMRTAMGSAQWLSVHNHPDTESAVAALQRDGYRLYASDLSPTSRDIRTVEWNLPLREDGETSERCSERLEGDADAPICIVMGNEERGISDELRKLADETFYLPMVGFAESFNLSVATAITLAHLSAIDEKEGLVKKRGPIRAGDLSKREYDCLVLKGLYNSMAQKRAAHAVLKKAGITLPQDLR